MMPTLGLIEAFDRLAAVEQAKRSKQVNLQGW